MVTTDQRPVLAHLGQTFWNLVAKIVNFGLLAPTAPKVGKFIGIGH